MTKLSTNSSIIIEDTITSVMPLGINIIVLFLHVYFG